MTERKTSATMNCHVIAGLCILRSSVSIFSICLTCEPLTAYRTSGVAKTIFLIPDNGKSEMSAYVSMRKLVALSVTWSREDTSSR